MVPSPVAAPNTSPLKYKYEYCIFQIYFLKPVGSIAAHDRAAVFNTPYTYWINTDENMLIY